VRAAKVSREESPATSPTAIARRLAELDPKLAPIIERVGPYRIALRTEGTHFDAVARAIVYQQLSTRAASTIYGRVVERFGRSPTPADLLGTPEPDLRAAGLSRQKIGYLRDLASRTDAAELPIDGLHLLDDDGVVEALTRIKGVGRWTAQMFLIFRLGRQDVLAEGDLGIRKAIQSAYRMRELPPPAKVETIGARWKPYRSCACWYLWRSLDNGFWG
jgi:3-methyladenine DNA glycosylase/8-oxoguanine DNA glycosylase